MRLTDAPVSTRRVSGLFETDVETIMFGKYLLDEFVVTLCIFTSSFSDAVNVGDTADLEDTVDAENSADLEDAENVGDTADFDETTDAKDTPGLT